jgi:hypothetical protein
MDIQIEVVRMRSSRRLGSARAVCALAMLGALVGGQVHAAPPPKPCDAKATSVVLNQAFGTDAPTAIAPQPYPFPGCTPAPFLPPDQQQAVDPRVLWPGVTWVYPTYLTDLGAKVPALVAKLSGSGFKVTVPLKRANSGIATTYAPAQWLKVPAGAVTTGGTITLQIFRQSGKKLVAVGQNTFRTPV